MKNLSLLENRIKNRQNTLMIFDYYGTLTPINIHHPELAVASPIIQRCLKNLSKLDNLEIIILCSKKLKDFDCEDIHFCILEKAVKQDIVRKIIESYKDYFIFYFGNDADDICAFKEVQKSSGIAIGIAPLEIAVEDFVNSKISYIRLEELLADLNNVCIS